MGYDDKIVLVEFGNRLRQIRKAKGLSQRELAALADMENPHIAKIEAGQVDIRLSTVMKLIWVLQVNPNELLPKV